MSARLAAAAASLIALAATGCVAAAVGTAGAVGVAAVQERTVGQAVDDAATSNEIKAQLIAEGGMNEVDVEVESDLVLLSGRVDTPAQRTRAEDIAWSVERVTDVANEIRIGRPGSFMDQLSDEMTTARVRRALVASSSVRSYNFNIETYDGIVYLMGIARTHEEMVAAAEEAAHVGGVKQVVSYIRVRDPARGAASVADDTSASEAAAERELVGGSW